MCRPLRIGRHPAVHGPQTPPKHASKEKHESNKVAGTNSDTKHSAAAIELLGRIANISCCSRLIFVTVVWKNQTARPLIETHKPSTTKFLNK